MPIEMAICCSRWLMLMFAADCSGYKNDKDMVENIKCRLSHCDI